MLRITLILALFFSTLAAAALPERCEEGLWGASHVRFAREGVEIDRFPAKVYPLATILRNLDLDEIQISNLNGRILLLGEGFSDFLPALVHRHKNVRALDPIYGISSWPEGAPYADAYKSYIERHKVWLIAHRAEQRWPLNDSSADWIFSHMLLSSFWSYVPVRRILEETVRVLAPGGRAVFAWYARSQSMPFFDQVLKPYVQLGIRVSYSDNGKDQPYIPDAQLDALLLQKAGLIRPDWRRDGSNARVQRLHIYKQR